MAISPWLGAILALASFTSAMVVPASSLVESRDLDIHAARDAQCTHGPQSRSCWNQGFSLNSDFDKTHPTTGNTVTYDFVITNTTCNPDGYGERVCMLINGQYPGPVIRATWGDMVVVNVHNQLPDNGTTIHFHGVQQLNTPAADGVNGVTQCPIAPSNSMTYTFQATQYGTSWYHSHYTVQYGDGVMGPIVFDGPATADYDTDLGPYMVGDWTHSTAFQVNAVQEPAIDAGQIPPGPDTILINGTNKNINGGGSYNQVKITSGQKYLLRLINPSVDNYIRVSLDNHPFQVITSDFVPINPIYTEWLLMGPGQRYSVVIDANQTSGNYWFRAVAAADCASNNKFSALAIWTYSDASVSTPSSDQYPTPTVCLEPSPLAPYWVQAVPSGSFQSMANDLDLSQTQAQNVPGKGDVVTVWSLNANSSMWVDWAKPTFSYVREGNTSYTDRMEVLPVLSPGSWNYWLIQQQSNNPKIPHPIHLHGHDFYVLGQGTSSTWTPDDQLNYGTPTRRDTATIYSGGWLAIAFQSNNPGVWLMHCHIAWHIAEGLGVQFYESADSMVMPDWDAYDDVCDAWSNFAKGTPYPQDDSGL